MHATNASLLRLLAALALAGCSNVVAVQASDGATDVAADDVAALDVPANATDAPLDATTDARPDVPPDDVDPICTNHATDRCLGMPPGPCADLADGLEHVVSFRGFARDHRVSCQGTQTSMGPDAVLPLTVTQTSDIGITVAPDTGDTVVVALVPADACGDPRAEVQCANGSNSIGGITVIRASSVPPGRYSVIVGTIRGVDARVSAMVTPARVRPPGDLCPGVRLVPDGEAVSIDTQRFYTTDDYGTTCGYGRTGGLGWVDAVVTFTTTATRDVTVDVEGTGAEDVNVEVSSVCGSAPYVIPGCTSGLPASHTLRNLPAGTWYAVIDYRPVGRPDHVLSARVTTAPPTPPGPAATCPGVTLAEGASLSLPVDTLTPGAPLMCLQRQHASAYVSFVAPSDPGDVLVNVATSDPRSDAALQLRAPCEGDAVGACVGPLDRTARSVWSRYHGLTPGQTYYAQASTNSVGGTLQTLWRRVPAAEVQTVAGNLTCDTAFAITGTGGVFTGTTDMATMVATPSCASGMMAGCTGSRGVLYRLDLAERKRVVAILDGSGFDALLAFFQGDTCPGRNLQGGQGCNDDWYGTNSQVDVTLMPGRYWIHAGGCGTAQSGSYRLDVAVLPP